MVCYLYYRIGTPLRPYEKPMFYGYTFDRKLAKMFRHYRDMKYFLEKEVTYDKNGKQEFEKRYRKYCIHMGTFETKNPNDLGRNRVAVDIPCTLMEEEMVFTKIDQVLYEIGKSINFYPLLIYGNRSLKSLLKKAKVKEIYDLAQIYFQGTTPTERLFAGDTSFDCTPNIGTRVDQFGIFIYLYGDTLRLGKEG